MTPPRFSIVLLAALGSSSCLVGPKYVRPDAPSAASFKEPGPTYFKEAPGWKQGQPMDDMHRGKWWEIFNDPNLNALEEQIETSNPTIAAAEAQYRGSRAAISVTRSQLYPTLNGGASVVGTGTSGNSNPNSRFGASQFAVITLPTANATWTPDFWGQIRRSIEANVDFAQASAADLANTRLSLETTLALDYFLLRGLDAQKQLLDSTAEAYQKALQLTVNRYNQGVASQVDVAQAQTQLAQTQAQSTDTLVARQQFEHAIAILIGKPPSEFSIAFSPTIPNPPPVPGLLPSELLERRPDIAGNERRIAATNAQVGVNTAAYYPNITLSAGGGLESTSLLSLFTWPSRFWSLGPSLSETILDFGRRRAQIQVSEASYDQAVANYRSSVLTAFQQVEDQLSTLRVLEQEAEQQSGAVNYAERSLQLANAQYEGGITNYLQVITAQEIALQNEVVAVQLKTRRMTASVSLIEALGGGWDASQLPTPQQVTPQKPPKVTTTSQP
jgi:NodT family efflux transporter outer membrane factor (OMF) lipoprotein